MYLEHTLQHTGIQRLNFNIRKKVILNLKAHERRRFNYDDETPLRSNSSMRLQWLSLTNLERRCVTSLSISSRSSQKLGVGLQLLRLQPEGSMHACGRISGWKQLKDDIYLVLHVIVDLTKGGKVFMAHKYTLR